MATRSIKELLADPEFLDKVAEGVAQDMAARRQARVDFLHSETFNRMTVSLRDNTEPVSIHSEDVSYFAERVKGEAGWEFATDSDIRLFFDIIASPDADTVEPGSLTVDEDCMFENCSFKNHGLHVWMMSGQGTVISVSNDAAFRSRNAEEPPAA